MTRTFLPLMNKDAPYPRQNPLQSNCRKQIQVTSPLPFSPTKMQRVDRVFQAVELFTNSLQVWLWSPRPVAGLSQGCPIATLVPGEVHSILWARACRAQGGGRDKTRTIGVLSLNEETNQITTATPSREAMETQLMVWGSRFHWEGGCPGPRRVLGVPTTHEAPWDEVALPCPKGSGDPSAGRRGAGSSGWSHPRTWWQAEQQVVAGPRRMRLRMLPAWWHRPGAGTCPIAQGAGVLVPCGSAKLRSLRGFTSPFFNPCFFQTTEKGQASLFASPLQRRHPPVRLQRHFMSIFSPSHHEAPALNVGKCSNFSFPTSGASYFKIKPPACPLISPKSSRTPVIPVKCGCFICGFGSAMTRTDAPF